MPLFYHGAAAMSKDKSCVPGTTNLSHQEPEDSYALAVEIDSGFAGYYRKLSRSSAHFGQARGGNIAEVKLRPDAPVMDIGQK
jgi:hypothetical protein